MDDSVIGQISKMNSVDKPNVVRTDQDTNQDVPRVNVDGKHLLPGIHLINQGLDYGINIDISRVGIVQDVKELTSDDLINYHKPIKEIKGIDRT